MQPSFFDQLGAIGRGIQQGLQPSALPKSGFDLSGVTSELDALNTRTAAMAEQRMRMQAQAQKIQQQAQREMALRNFQAQFKGTPLEMASILAPEKLIETMFTPQDPLKALQQEKLRRELAGTDPKSVEELTRRVGAIDVASKGAEQGLTGAQHFIDNPQSPLEPGSTWLGETVGTVGAELGRMLPGLATNAIDYFTGYDLKSLGADRVARDQMDSGLSNMLVGLQGVQRQAGQQLRGSFENLEKAKGNTDMTLPALLETMETNLNTIVGWADRNNVSGPEVEAARAQAQRAGQLRKLRQMNQTKLKPGETELAIDKSGQSYQNGQQYVFTVGGKTYRGTYNAATNSMEDASEI
jgi:hypothetical protein